MYVSNPYGEACQPIVVDTEGLGADHPTVGVLRRFFEDYKQLEGKEVHVHDFLDPAEARAVVRKDLELYNQKIRK